MRDTHARLLEALRAIADMPEHAPPGGIEFWLDELERLVGWTAEVRSDGALDVRSRDGRSWARVTLLDLVQLVERIGEG